MLSNLLSIGRSRTSEVELFCSESYSANSRTEVMAGLVRTKITSALANIVLCFVQFNDFSSILS